MLQGIGFLTPHNKARKGTIFCAHLQIISCFFAFFLILHVLFVYIALESMCFWGLMAFSFFPKRVTKNRTFARFIVGYQKPDALQHSCIVEIRIIFLSWEQIQSSIFLVARSLRVRSISCGYASSCGQASCLSPHKFIPLPRAVVMTRPTPRSTALRSTPLIRCKMRRSDTTPTSPLSISHLPLLPAWFLAEETLVARLPQTETTPLIPTCQTIMTLEMANCLKVGSIQSIHLTLDTNPINPQLAKHGWCCCLLLQQHWQSISARGKRWLKSSVPIKCHLSAPYLHWNLIGTWLESHWNLTEGIPRFLHTDRKSVV